MTTIDGYRENQNLTPLSEENIDVLNKKIYLYLESEGIVDDYKSASCQVTGLYSAIITAFKQIYDHNHGGFYLYKDRFLKTQSNKRENLKRSGVKVIEKDDGRELRSANLPPTITG